MLLFAHLTGDLAAVCLVWVQNFATMSTVVALAMQWRVASEDTESLMTSATPEVGTHA